MRNCDRCTSRIVPRHVLPHSWGTEVVYVGHGAGALWPKSGVIHARWTGQVTERRTRIRQHTWLRKWVFGTARGASEAERGEKLWGWRLGWMGKMLGWRGTDLLGSHSMGCGNGGNGNGGGGGGGGSKRDNDTVQDPSQPTITTYPNPTSTPVRRGSD